jgi:hypothetical protein
MSFAEFLAYLAGPGINAALGVALSWIIEWFPGFETATPRVKRLITLLLCLAIPVLATVGLVLIGAADPHLVDTWWLAVMSGALAYGGSQVAHLRKLSNTKE